MKDCRVCYPSVTEAKDFPGSHSVADASKDIDVCAHRLPGRPRILSRLREVGKRHVGFRHASAIRRSRRHPRGATVTANSHSQRTLAMAEALGPLRRRFQRMTE